MTRTGVLELPESGVELSVPPVSYRATVSGTPPSTSPFHSAEATWRREVRALVARSIAGAMVRRFPANEEAVALSAALVEGTLADGSCPPRSVPKPAAQTRARAETLPATGRGRLPLKHEQSTSSGKCSGGGGCNSSGSEAIPSFKDRQASLSAFRAAQQRGACTRSTLVGNAAEPSSNVHLRPPRVVLSTPPPPPLAVLPPPPPPPPPPQISGA